jgi:hypothetical protein
MLVARRSLVWFVFWSLSNKPPSRVGIDLYFGPSIAAHHPTVFLGRGGRCMLVVVA